MALTGIPDSHPASRSGKARTIKMVSRGQDPQAQKLAEVEDSLGVYIEFCDQFEEVLQKTQEQLKDTCAELEIPAGAKEAQAALLLKIFKEMKTRMLS